MRMTWANRCRKANGESLIPSHGSLLTPTQACLDPRSHSLARQFENAIQDNMLRTLERPEPVIPIQDSQDAPPLEATTPNKIPKQLTTFNMMALPYDIRRKFLKTVFPKTSFGFFLPGANGHRRVGIPFPSNIMLTTKQLRTEALHVAINQTEIQIHSGIGNTTFQTWLGGIDLTSLHGDTATDINTGFDAVYRLNFPYFSRFPHRNLPVGTPNNDVELMRKCPKLRELKLNFVGQELLQRGVEKDAEQLREEYRLDGILGLEKLKRVVLVGPVDTEGLGLKGLAEWFREGFEKAGKKVQVITD